MLESLLMAWFFFYLLSILCGHRTQIHFQLKHLRFNLELQIEM